jgi:methyl-accepting chemotaxis protein
VQNAIKSIFLTEDVNAFSDLYLLFMVLVFSVVLLAVIFHYHRIKTLNKKLSSELDIIEEKQMDEDIEKRIAKRFYLLNEWIEGFTKYTYFIPGVFKKNWKIYYKARTNADVHSTIDVYDYFIEDQLVTRFGYRKTLEAIPALFVTLGILGTFWGLVLGIGTLNMDGSSEQLKDGVNGLLNGMSLAFISSILGIVFSLIFQYLDKLYLLPLLVNNFRDIRQLLDEALPTKDESSLLKEMLDVQQTQMEDLKTFFTDEFVTKITDGFNDVVVNGLNPHLEKSNAILEKVATSTTEAQAEKMNEMVDYFVKELNSVTGEHMNALSSTLAKTVEWQEKVFGEMQHLVENLKTASAEQTQMIEKTTGLTDQITVLSDQLGNYQTTLLETVDSFNNTVDKNKELQHESNQLIDKMIEERKEMNTELQKFTASIEGMINYSEQLHELQSELQSFIGQINGISGQINSSIEINKELTTEFNKTLELNNSANGSLENVIGQFTYTLDTYQELHNDMQSLYKNVSEERSLMDHRTAEQNEYLEKQMIQMGDIVNSLKVHWSESVEKLEENKELFAEINTQLSESMNDFANHMHQGLDRTFDQFDKQLADSVQYLDRGVSSIRSVIEEVTEEVDKISGAIKDFRTGLEQAAVSVGVKE